jgi:hypothetical protein
LQDLDLRLSAEILKDTSQWQLEPIAADLIRFRSNASQQTDIVTADHILNKLRRFQSIQLGGSGAQATLAVSGSPAVSGVQAIVGQQAIPIDRVAGEMAGPNGAAYAQTYDAHGWLNELVRDGGMGQSTYVLQDDTGRITHVISGTPGLNLHRYLKTKVGIIGQKGYHQRMNLDHVTAERIVDLDTLRR